MDFLDPAISNYAEAHSSPESELLQELNRDTYANVLIPRMLSGHLQGRVLSMFSKMHRPRVILEIGTYTGYSALCLAEGLTSGGKLITIDINEEIEDMTRGYFDKSPNPEVFDYRVGNAMDIIPTLTDQIDMVFIDADKENYTNYYDLVIDKMPSGGILIADNVLWSGKVLDRKQLANDEETKALNDFNTKMNTDNRVENVLMPIRDGLMVVRKK
ncbi:MAG: caffeoyl-CoA O-methyltransferase [Bacteroidia bacterium]|jgi:caffeoyl-CoA O-methyltransferase